MDTSKDNTNTDTKAPPVQTITGRKPSRPGMQNIPVRTELGRKMRAAFIPRSRKCQLL